MGGAGHEAPPPGPRPGRPHPLQPESPWSLPGWALPRLRASPTSGARQGLPGSTSATDGALSHERGARGTVGLGQAPAPHPGRPRTSALSCGGRGGHTCGRRSLLDTVLPDRRGPGSGRAQGAGLGRERSARGREGGTTEKTSPPFGATPFASAARPQGKAEADSPRGPSTPLPVLAEAGPSRAPGEHWGSVQTDFH